MRKDSVGEQATIVGTSEFKQGGRMNPANNRKRGKALERHTAQRINGKRVGTMGGEDVSHPLFSVECKSRKAFVGTGWMSQAVRHCPEGKTPLVVIHVHGQRHSEDLIMMRMQDFEDMSGDLFRRRDA